MNFTDMDSSSQSKNITYKMSVSKKAIEASDYYKHLITIGTDETQAINEALHNLGGDLENSDIVQTYGVVRCSENKLEGYHDTVYNLTTRWSFIKKHLWENIDCLALPTAPEGLAITIQELGEGWVPPEEDDLSHEAVSKKQKRAVRTPKFKNESEV